MISKDKIINVRFNRSRKGYSIEEVDAFLDEIVGDLSAVEAERQADAERMLKVKENENALAQALLIAQKTANDLETKAQVTAAETIADANAQAEEIINNAKIEAYNIRAKNDEEIRGQREELERLKQFIRDYKLAVVADMDRQKEDFLENFASDDMLNAEIANPEAEVLPEEEPVDDGKELLEEEVAVSEEDAAEAEELPEAVEDAHEENVVEPEKEELQTDHIETINLDDILSGLPETDHELKALIDEIME